MTFTILLTSATLLAGSALAASPARTWVAGPEVAATVPPPPSPANTRAELEWLRFAATEPNPLIDEQVRYWNAGPPSYRWMQILAKRQSDGLPIGAFPRAYAYVALAIHDATAAALTAKQVHQRNRPRGVPARIAVPESPSYPSDYAATAAAAAGVMAYLVSAEAAAFQSLAEEAGKSRLYAGVEHPSDYLAGMELGRKVAELVIQKARMDGSDIPWTGAVPTGPCRWTGVNPGNAAAANWRPLLLSSPGEFRSAPPPACDSPAMQAQVAGVRNFPRALTMANLNTNASALYWQTPEGIYPWAIDLMSQWILEDKLERDPLRAARAYALVSAAGYDAFIASQDGKFTYWFPRPAQLDTSLTPLFQAPNFPSYPSNHSTLSSSRAEVLAYLFPDRAAFIRERAAEAGNSRIWAGIHFQIDNEAGMELGRKVARKFIAHAEANGLGK